MKLSRGVVKLGLSIVTLATVLVATHPQLAVWLANAGDRLSALGIKLACYGH